MDVDVAAVAPNTPTRAPGSPREFVRTRSRTVSNRASQSAMVVTPTKQLIAAVSDLYVQQQLRSHLLKFFVCLILTYSLLNRKLL